MDEMIQAVASALEAGHTVEKIHDALKEKGLSEDDCYLMIQAGSYLSTCRFNLEVEKLNRKPPFGRR